MGKRNYDDIYVTGTGQVMHYVHGKDECDGNPCPIHNPTDHPLRDAPTHWRYDRKIMERMCEHGVGHPDPDDIHVRTVEGEGVHGCDGCCQGIYHILNKPRDSVRIMDRWITYKEAWNDLRSAIKGVKTLYGDEEIRIDYLLSFMDKKEKRLQ